jgi:hypothetical protein
VTRQTSGATAIDFGSQPCDICGGGTYTFPSGSIWCPLEDPHPGGHFVKRADPDPMKKWRRETGPRVRKVKDIVAKVEAERGVIQSVTDDDDVVRHDPIHNL